MNCLKDYTIEVTSPLTAVLYWTLNGPINSNHDEVTGDLIVYNNVSSFLSEVPAIQADGLDITGVGGFCTIQNQGPTLAYDGNGFSLAFWMRWGSAGTGNEGIFYQWDTSGLPGFFSWLVGTGEYHFTHSGGDTTGNTPLMSSDAFHFVVFTYDPVTGQLRMSVDGAATSLISTPGVVPPLADPNAYFLAGNEEVRYDEVAVFPFPLNAAQIAYLYNGGTGRTWPLSLPP